ncbi:MAG: DPP IV N-terminal domain-containing protein [Chloroflexota bacterium]
MLRKSVVLSIVLMLAGAGMSSAQQVAGKGQIAFMYFYPETKTYSLMVIDLDNSAGQFYPVALASDLASTARPNWSLNGRSITFTEQVDGKDDVFSVESNGQNLRNLTNDPATDTDPVLSPNGKQIAFTSDRGKEAGQLEIYVMDADGSNVTRITRSGSDGSATLPTWQPNGQTLTYFYRPTKDAKPEVHTVNADGLGEKPLLPAQNYLGPVVWAPDGKRLAVVHSVDNRFELVVDNADGTMLPPLMLGSTPLPESSEPQFVLTPYHFAWSPDSQKIAFEYNADGNYEIYVIDLNTLKIINATGDGSGDRMPTWSPDGRSIAFITNRNLQYELYTMNPDGSNLTRLSMTGRDEINPLWTLPAPLDF